MSHDSLTAQCFTYSIEIWNDHRGWQAIFTENKAARDDFFWELYAANIKATIRLCTKGRETWRITDGRWIKPGWTKEVDVDKLLEELER